MVGTIPIVISTPLDELFDDLPVLIVDDWEVITEGFLIQEYERMLQKDYSFKLC